MAHQTALCLGTLLDVDVEPLGGATSILHLTIALSTACRICRGKHWFVDPVASVVAR